MCSQYEATLSLFSIICSEHTTHLTTYSHLKVTHCRCRTTLSPRKAHITVEHSVTITQFVLSFIYLSISPKMHPSPLPPLFFSLCCLRCCCCCFCCRVLLSLQCYGSIERELTRFAAAAVFCLFSYIANLLTTKARSNGYCNCYFPPLLSFSLFNITFIMVTRCLETLPTCQRSIPGLPLIGTTISVPLYRG